MDRRRSNVRRRILLFCHFGGAGRIMGIELLSDKSILRYYEQIRQQLAADLATENRFRLVGSEAVKQRTERLRMEIDRRRLRCDPIEWGDLSEIRGTDPATKSPAGERD
jgi:hypothetical protein